MNGYNKLVNSCSLCGLCETVCPQHMPMQDICLQARQSLVKRNKMPPSAHEFAIQDMLFANGEETSFCSHEPGKRKSAFLFFPGCQLGAIYPDLVICIYGFLRDHLRGGVGILSRCCAVPARWAGREDLFDETCKEFMDKWQNLGSPVIIAACPTCYRIIKEIFSNAKCIMLSEVFFEYRIPIQTKDTFPSLHLAIHDPCSARYEPSIQESVRRLLSSIGCHVAELVLSREKTECCGFGGLMSNANPSLAKDVATTRSLRCEAVYVTYCVMCRNALASSGKRVIYLYDLLFGKPKEDYATRKPVGFSARRENRRWLKNKLMNDLWGNEKADEADYEKIVLDLTDTANKLMQERRILKEDIQKAIEHAETTGEKFCNSETGRLLTSFRPENVTFWVEYETNGIQFKIFRLYSHRMTVVNRVAMRDMEKHKENEWVCAKCNIGLQSCKTNVCYLGNTFTTDFLSCRNCKMVLVSEDVAIGRMAEVEQILEDK